MYEIEDHEGEPIIGKCYEEELSAVEKKDNTYRLEKILKKKKVWRWKSGWGTIADHGYR